MENLEKEATEFIKGVAKTRGLDDLSATILALLFMEPEEITLEEIVNKTGYSLASVSTKVKIFSDMGLVSRKTKPGTKKIYLYMEKDFLGLIKDYSDKIRSGMDVAESEVGRMLKDYKCKEKGEREKKQVKILMQVQDYLTKVKPLFELFFKKVEELK